MAKPEVLTPQADDFPQWYQDVIAKAELAEGGPVRGTIVIRPYGYAIWERMQAEMDARIKAAGARNAYFPLFIPDSYFHREAEHVEGFSPELAVVTHGGGKKLEEPVVVRPTSETIIDSFLAKWIQSYRDLPLLVNQWANVVRWELRTRLFLRGSEFLWQEGHTAHATAEEADAEARLILDLYVRLIEEELAIPVIAGTKTESERFAGATGTYTVESLMGDARVLQMGTSHDLGQNFSKAFDVTFLDRDGKEAFPWSTSWAVSTRLIGALVMVHGDKKGLRLPPRIAPTQVVIVPIWRNDQERSSIEPLVAEVQSELVRAGIRVHVDWRDQVRPGFKFNFWEMKGVPVRLEIGPRDAANRTVVAARRDTGEKVTMPVDGLASVVAKLLAGVQQGLFDEAKRFLDEHTSQAATWEEMERYLVEPGGLVWVNWCDSQECEQALAGLKATVRAIPLDEEARRPTGPCVCRMGHGAQFRAAVARSY